MLKKNDSTFLFMSSLLLMAAFLIFPTNTFAFDHGYERRTDEIYAMARYDLAIYEDNSSGNLQTMLAAFKKVVVVGETDSWYEVTYTEDSSTHYGWVTKGDFESDCLIYDGSEKQPMANGKYNITYKSKALEGNMFSEEDVLQSDIVNLGNNLILNNLCFDITFTGNNRYKIKRTDTNEFLQSDALFSEEKEPELWGAEATAGSFCLTRKGNCYAIQDGTTNRYFGLDDNGLLCFSKNQGYYWRFNRLRKAVSKNVLRVFAQYDPDWAKTYYGKGTNDTPSENNFCTSACGIFATMNTIYALTGQKASPYKLANYAVEQHFRIQGCGTDSGFFEAAAEEFGEKYGFKYDGSSGSFEDLKEKLNDGDCAIVYLPHHYASIVKYDEDRQQYLLLDSHYLPKRATCCYGDWVSQSDLESGELVAQMFFFYKRINH